MTFTDFKQPFIIYTDASWIGLGVVLYQVIDRKEHVIGYGSHSLNKRESSYTTHKVEFVTLKSAVTKVIHDYLFGNQFIVKLDNNPLMYVLTTAQLDAMGHHWVAQLTSYNFTVLYSSGKTTNEADDLSRIDWDQELTSEVVRVILETTMNGCSLLAKTDAHTTTIIPSFLVAIGIASLEAGEAVPK